MDRPDASPAELEAALRVCAGSIATSAAIGSSRHFLRRWIKRGDQLRVLDLATGIG